MMKRLIYLLSFTFFLSPAFAQDDEGRNGEKVRERMNEYIQKRLGLSKSEADRFAPVFIEYFRELRNTNQQYRNDKLVQQQKITDLRIRYRDQFRNILGEKRGNDVFVFEREFINEVKELRQERQQNRPAKRF